MKTIIAGSRDITDQATVNNLLNSITWPITEVVSGCARGVDSLGEEWAKEHNIPVKLFPVTKEDWKRKGMSAGHQRNRQMGDYAEALIAIWDGVSSGTKGMIEYAKKKGLKVVVFTPKNNEIQG